MYFSLTESQNPGMVWMGRYPKSPLVLPPAMVRDTSHQAKVA